MNHYNQHRSSKTVLILSEGFPPRSFVGGLRPAMFSKYLARFGWRVFLLTSKRPEAESDKQLSIDFDGLPNAEDRCEVIWGSVDRAKVRKSWGLFDRFLFLIRPDFSQSQGLIESSTIEARKFLKTRAVDVIYATSPGIYYITMGRELARTYAVPWVADFRDIHEQERCRNLREVLLHYRLKLRRKTITKTASRVITVSEHHADTLASSLNRQVSVITNGYDPDLFFPLENHRAEKFTISYFGRVLDEWLRNPRPLFEAIDVLLARSEIDREQVALKFYGSEAEIVNSIVLPYNCREIVETVRKVEYSAVPNLMQQSCINLVLTNAGRTGVMTTKVFEYLAVKRPILSVPDDGGELAAMVRQTRAGYVCGSEEEIVEVLKSWYTEWEKTGTVRCNSIDERVQKYSRSAQAHKLSAILNEAIENQRRISSGVFTRRKQHRV